jgi:thymidine phosphorylase
MVLFRDALMRLSKRPDDDALDDLIAASSGPVTDEEIADLARTLANSGDTLPMPPCAIAADVASTGGPASLSTLLCPLYLRCMGAQVPKIGVPGRPAGAIDVMSNVPKYQIRLPLEIARNILANAGYVHVLAAGHYAPLDGRLFARRQLKHAMSVQALVIASLLSKKLAASLTHVGVEIRVSPNGNFGSTWDEAKMNAHRFVRIAGLLEMRAKCFLTEGTYAIQPYIGRGEALLALSRLLFGVDEPWLLQHAKRCFEMAAATIGHSDRKMPSSAELVSYFEANLIAQGASLLAFHNAADSAASATRIILRAEHSGFLEINLMALRDAIVHANQQDRSSADSFPDVAGVILACRPDHFVLAGDSLAEIRCPAGHLSSLRDAFRVIPSGSQKDGYEEV